MARAHVNTGIKAKIVAENRKARYEFFIDEVVEAGIALAGTEVKALRQGEGSIAESYAELKDGQMWLVNANIPEFSHGNRNNHEPKRPRKLLMHAKQISKFNGAVTRQGMTVIPLMIYFNDRGRAKVELALAKGKKLHDKRETEKTRDWKRDAARIMRERGVTMSDDDITREAGFKEKLVASKQAWARAGRLLTGKDADPATDRLPPGQRLVENWPVLDLGIQPDVPREAWELTVGGLVEAPVTWNFAALMAQPQFEDMSDIHCVTSWSRYDNRWQGVSTRRLIEVVHPRPEAAHVILHGYDGYVTNLRLADFADDDCLLAHSHDGQAITREHGGPVRAIIPRYYLWKSAKWLKAIEFVAADHPGFWETRGYHNIADPWLEQRYS